ncbi:MAG: F0F1 ATP synthase subunit A [Microbacteriaceae bacterium]|nr:F0F1 ATP synthase subunit A [Microbacteriaceae bacterium]
MIAPLLQADDDFHSPSLSEWIGLPQILFEGTPFAMNRIILVRIIAIAVMLLLFWLALRKARVVPSRGQSVGEMAMDFVRVQIAEELLGKRLGTKYTPLLASIFFAILAANLTGVIPGLNIAGSSLVAFPLALGIVAYIAFIYAGTKEVGFGRFVTGHLFPAGAPAWIYVILTPVEFINIFIVRPLSLALRLLLNMVVGHLLLVLCFAGTHFLFFSSQIESGWMRWFGVGTLLGGIVITIVELAVAALQAYVFTLLTAAYIQQAVSEEH